MVLMSMVYSEGTSVEDEEELEDEELELLEDEFEDVLLLLLVGSTATTVI